MEYYTSEVKIDKQIITFKSTLGEIKSVLIENYPRLKLAKLSELQKFELSPFGIHWPSLDEDLSFEGIFRGSLNIIILGSSLKKVSQVVISQSEVF